MCWDDSCALSHESGVSHQVRQWTSTACSRQHKLRCYSQLRNKENRAPRAQPRDKRDTCQRTKQRHKIGIRQCMLETL